MQLALTHHTERARLHSVDVGVQLDASAGRLTLQSDRVQADVALLPKGRPDVPGSPREWGHSLVTEIRGVSLEPVQRLTDLRYLGRLLVGKLLLGYPLPQPKRQWGPKIFAHRDQSCGLLPECSKCS